MKGEFSLKKWINFIAVFLISLFLIAGCTDINNQEVEQTSHSDMKQLFKVDVQKVKLDGSNGDFVTITDKENLNLLGIAFGNIQWNQNVEPPLMEKREDIKASLFYDLDKDKEPKKIADYAIWFNSDETATIIMEDRIFGELDKENAKILREILISE